MQGWSRQLRLTPLNPVANIATKIIAGLMLGLIAVAATYIAALWQPCSGWSATSTSSLRWAAATGCWPLTERETDVLSVARAGGTIADIARSLSLSEGTVRNYLSSAIGKTSARTRADAVRIAEQNGWLLR
jgi:DNA-binding NarL/FixJ family response regulator